MSLENKIETLTSAINALNVNIAKLVNVPICDEPELAAEILDRELPKAKQAKEKAEQAPEMSHKDLQDFIMSFVREDMKRKPKIKALLAKHSASKVTDLDVSKLADFKAELVAL